MKIPQNAHVVVANGEKFMLLRNTGQPFEPKLEQIANPDLLLTNFSAGARHQDSAGGRSGSTDIDELAHGAAIADFLNEKALKNELGDVVIVADPKTLGQIRQHYHKKTDAQVVGELDKDLTNSPIPDIEAALAKA